MAAMEDKAKALDIKGAVASLIISAFGFVAALFWRDAIREAIDEFVPAGEGMLYSFGIAVLVTIIAVIVIYILSKYMTVSIVRKNVKEKVTVRNIQNIDNRLFGRDITIRNRKKKNKEKIK